MSPQIKKIIVSIFLVALICGVVAFYANVPLQNAVAPVVPAGTTAVPVVTPTSTVLAGTSTSPVVATTSVTRVVTQADMGTTVHLTVGQKFTLQLSDLNWRISFSDPSIVTELPPVSLPSGTVGMYEANRVGTTALDGTGAPICNPGQACPDFLAVFRATIVVAE